MAISIPPSSSPVSSKRGPRIVVAVDFEQQSIGALRRAIAVAAVQNAELHVLCVREPGSLVPALHTDVPPDALTRLRNLTTQELEAASAILESGRIPKVVTHLLGGSPAAEIVWLAAHLDADLIVMGTHGRKGVSRMMLGSVAEKVARTAGCPVLVERVKHHDEATKVPEIEPLCDRCQAHRIASNGAELWCAEHGSHHLHSHVYHGRDDGSERARPWGFSV
jgi:nucleotide-binding universal stress UspA family protein